MLLHPSAQSSIKQTPLVRLINSKPRSPTRDEIIAILTAPGAASRINVSASCEAGTSVIRRLARELGDVEQQYEAAARVSRRAFDEHELRANKILERSSEIEQEIAGIEPQTADERAVWAVLLAKNLHETGTLGADWGLLLSSWLMERALQDARITLETLGLNHYVETYMGPRTRHEPGGVTIAA